MNATASAATYANVLLSTQMTKVASVTPSNQFGPILTAAQARAARMTPEERASTIDKIAKTAKDFEAQFVGTMMGSMYQNVDLGAGEGADAFKSIMMQAVGKKVASGRGIGMAAQVQAEMMKLQGLS